MNELGRDGGILSVGQRCGDQTGMDGVHRNPTALVKSFDSQQSATTVLDRLPRIPARGLTNVSSGLEGAQAALAHSSLRRRSILLLSDVVHNAGPDPRTVAAHYNELHGLLEPDGEHDAAIGRWAGKGRTWEASPRCDLSRRSYGAQQASRRLADRRKALTASPIRAEALSGSSLLIRSQGHWLIEEQIRSSQHGDLAVEAQHG